MRGRTAAAVAGISLALLPASSAPAAPGPDRPAAGPAAGESALVARLVGRGFENVAVRARRDTVTVWYENRVLRYELEALGRVALLAASSVPGDAVLEIVPENDGVPLLSVSALSADWLTFLRGERTAAWFRERLAIRTDPSVGGSWLGAGRERHHLSRWKVDLRLRPLFDFELGVPDDPFRSSLEIAPEAVTSPFTGARLTAQVIVQLDDDLDPFARRVRPGRTTASWAGWAPGGVLCAVSAGYFAGDRYGFAGQLGKLLAGGVLEVTGGADLSGLLEFSREITRYSALRTWSGFVALTHRTRGLDLETTVTAARFMEEALGVRLDVARRFREVELGFFGIATEQDEVIGVGLAVPLPRRRWSPPSRVRFVTVPAFPFEYRDSLSDTGLRVSQFDDLDRLRKKLYPTFLLNNLRDLRDAVAE